MIARACLSRASWPVFRLASILLTLARLGVNGFGHFDRNQSGSAAGPNPGNTENHMKCFAKPVVHLTIECGQNQITIRFGG